MKKGDILLCKKRHTRELYIDNIDGEDDITVIVQYEVGKLYNVESISNPSINNLEIIWIFNKEYNHSCSFFTKQGSYHIWNIFHTPEETKNILRKQKLEKLNGNI